MTNEEFLRLHDEFTKAFLACAQVTQEAIEHLNKHADRIGAEVDAADTEFQVMRVSSWEGKAIRLPIAKKELGDAVEQANQRLQSVIAYLRATKVVFDAVKFQRDVAVALSTEECRSDLAPLITALEALVVAASVLVNNEALKIAELAVAMALHLEAVKLHQRKIQQFQDRAGAAYDEASRLFFCGAMASVQVLRKIAEAGVVLSQDTEQVLRTTGLSDWRSKWTQK